MKTPALQITQLTKRYDGVTVLDGIELALEQGECFALTGLNGAGKSTLLHCLLDFVPADRGRIDIDGKPHRDPAARRALAYLPERFLPPGFLTGWDFLRYAVALHAQAWDGKHAAATIEALSLPGAALARRTSTLSKGMAQQLGLAACLLVRPRLLVLDEPMAGLDPRAASVMQAALKAAHADGMAILFSTHELREVEALCDRVAILQSGQLRTIEREQIAGESLFVHHAI